VYFHNHGDPGAGLYFPERWNANRAQFSPRGTTLPVVFDVQSLFALPAEGFYRVKASFYCCEKHCVQYEPDMFVQLGYNGAGRALLFTPEIGTGGMTIPERGTPISDDAFRHLVALKVPERRDELALPRGIVVH
jgi:hypothetical protein